MTLVAKRIKRKPSAEEEDGDEVEEEGLSSRRKSRGRSTAEPGGGEEEGGGGGEVKKTTWGAKSAWVGRDDTEVGVEQWVLEQWEERGWKGYVVSLEQKKTRRSDADFVFCSSSPDSTPKDRS